MTAAEISMYRQRLLPLLQRHNDGVTRLQGEALHGLGGESGGGLSNAPTHLADLGNAYHEEEVGLILMQNEEQLLAECNAALAAHRGRDVRPVREVLQGYSSHPTRHLSLRSLLHALLAPAGAQRREGSGQFLRAKGHAKPQAEGKSPLAASHPGALSTGHRPGAVSSAHVRDIPAAVDFHVHLQFTY